ncbi:splicing factor, proline- and glutamine-rich [Drosophila elegans]|uniref:splicing factor, proline- and glutamine-rich n=1 Tax=Drosophila elegans TaxID=30023 RepID=UPI0007E70A82|nr:splicing factor, proline- and glutamine-rich [Drosophila elegans]
MSSPCGKCNNCPCGTSGGAPPPQQPPNRPPPSCAYQPQQQHHQQPDSCPYPQAQAAGGCQVNSNQPPGDPAACSVYQNRGGPTVECTCTQNRNRGPQPMPQVDHITCSRGPREQPPVMETRCTCREKPPKAECYCAPPVAPPPNQQATQAAQPTHAHVICGQSVPRGPQPYRHQHAGNHHGGNQTNSCGHCRSQKKQKKCLIQ